MSDSKAVKVTIALQNEQLSPPCPINKLEQYLKLT